MLKHKKLKLFRCSDMLLCQSINLNDRHSLDSKSYLQQSKRNIEVQKSIRLNKHHHQKANHSISAFSQNNQLNARAKHTSSIAQRKQERQSRWFKTAKHLDSDQGKFRDFSGSFNKSQGDQTLISYYSQHVFPENKFQRFTTLLKQRYLVTNNNSQVSNRSGYHNKEERKCREIHEEKLKTLIEVNKKITGGPAAKGRFFPNQEYFSPKIFLKQRPSSGVPCKTSQKDKKKIRKSFIQNPKNTSLEMKHLQLLRYSQSSHEQEPKSKKNFFMKRLKTESFGQDLRYMSEQIQRHPDIIPWEHEPTASNKNIGDIQVTVNYPM